MAFADISFQFTEHSECLIYTTGKGQGTLSQLPACKSSIITFSCISLSFTPQATLLSISGQLLGDDDEGDALVASQGLDVSGVLREGTWDSLVQLQQL